MASRRGFLKGVGGAAVAGPAVAKEAMANAGVGVFGSDPTLEGFADPCMPSPWFVERDGLLAKLNGKIPDHVMQKIRRRSQHVSHLDPDIASLHSVSLTAKVSMQRKRQLAKEIHDFWHGHELDLMSEKFREKIGGWL